ncbi:ABC transporter permease [Arthrobacter bambusae]|jgi:ABC-type dipeptide/oligopeptide/nickel transport system permease component|uniref:ABC transporter permease n=1 Tax=Arthrobacter TaxID=1663 RepID=UPI001F5078D4|nr:MULTISPECIES: ABC transporter permease [Arthrobacter]MCI0141279.1 ABC transporter permease [Arthrobacter bambusae]UYY82132.1 ABC transporter permease [Arthrobacter sp. YA7-1]
MLYFLRKTGLFVLTLWAAVTLNFLIPRLQPGDPAEAIVQKLAGQAQQVDPEQIRAIRLMLGVPDTSLWNQYWDYLNALVHGNFGLSYGYFPYSVTHMIAEALPYTLTLVGVTQIIAFVAGTGLGAWAAWRRNTKIDSFISLGSTFLSTLPFFWIALMLIYVLANTLHWFPEGGAYSGEIVPAFSSGFVADLAYHAVLPALALLITGSIGWILGMRNNMVQSLGSDYTRLAVAKGLKERRVAWTYAARIALLPNFTGFAISLGGVFGGTLIVEQIFSYPGMGKLMYDAIGNRDFPLLQAIFLITTVAVLLANFLADVLVGVLDPRVRRQSS